MTNCEKYQFFIFDIVHTTTDQTLDKKNIVLYMYVNDSIEVWDPCLFWKLSNSVFLIAPILFFALIGTWH